LHRGNQTLLLETTTLRCCAGVGEHRDDNDNPFQVPSVQWMQSRLPKRLRQMFVAMVVPKGSLGRKLPHRMSLSTQKLFYDSQSGGFIAVPGSAGMRVHDSWYAPRSRTGELRVSDAELVGYMRMAAENGIRSLSLPQVDDAQELQTTLYSSAQYLSRNRSKLPLQVAAQVWNSDQASALCKLTTLTPAARDVVVAETNVTFDCLNNKFLSDIAASGISTRVNLAVDISSTKGVIEVGEAMGALCDQGVKVINLALCSTSATGKRYHEF
jgi:hypothetical protein